MATKKRYFTAGHKEKVARRLVERSFDPKIKVAQEVRARAAHDALRAQLTPEEWALAASLPDNWLPRISSVSVGTLDGSLGHSTNVGFPEGEPSLAVPSTLMKATLTREKMGEFWETYREATLAEDRLKAEKRSTERQAEGLLAGFRTVEAAIEGWPEAEAVIQEVCGQGAPKQLPALAALNEVLDLPPEPDPADKPYRECGPADIALSA